MGLCFIACERSIASPLASLLDVGLDRFTRLAIGRRQVENHGAEAGPQAVKCGLGRRRWWSSCETRSVDT